MNNPPLNYYLRYLKQDIPAGIVVFLVALPLCLGIALASGTSLFSGLISGIIGGVVVSWLSGSQLSVSGPAAGLVVIVVSALATLGNFQTFLLAVFIAGFFQLVFGFARAGGIAAYFPVTVVKGMLSAIGILLIIKQFPLAVGFASDDELKYQVADVDRPMFEWMHYLHDISPIAVVITVGSLLILIVADTEKVKKNKVLSLIPGPLLVVVWGIVAHVASNSFSSEWKLLPAQLVNLPVLESANMFFQQLQLPDFTQFNNPQVYSIALTLAVVGSLETLLSLEAVDRLDPVKRIAPTDRELKAQGVGNMLSGLLGGLPITAVIVRSSANVNAGGHTKVSSFVHGILLLVSVLFLGHFLNYIPLSCLAALLLYTGYKLTKPQLFKQAWDQGRERFLSFAITILAILLTDLLRGIAIGLLFSIVMIVRSNFRSAMSLTEHDGHYLLRFHKDISFFSKVRLRRYLDSIPNNSFLIIDGSRAQFIDYDIQETILDFVEAAKDSNITVELRDLNSMSA